MKLNKTYDPNYTKSCMTMLYVTWTCIVMVTLADTITVLIEAKFISPALFTTGFRSFVLIPGTLNILTMAIIHGVSILLLRSERYVAQSVIYLAGVTIICFILAQSNYEMVIAFVLFSVPVLVGMFYLDTKIQITALVFGLVGFCSHLLILFSRDDAIIGDKLFSPNVETSLIIMAVVFALSIIIIRRYEYLHKHIKEEIERKHEDAFSGFPNHSGFYDDLDMVFKDADKIVGQFSLGLIDIDNFTYINEKYNHAFGDQILEIMVESINKSIVNTSKAYRYGGEEFAIICNAPQEVMLNMVDSILREFKNRTELKLGVKVTASAGVCEYDPDQFSGKRDVFAAVGEALYVAKRLGKDQSAVWNEALVRNSFVSAGDLATMESIIDDQRMDA